MSVADGTIYLPLKTRWYNEIRSGKKKIEYRNVWSNGKPSKWAKMIDGHFDDFHTLCFFIGQNVSAKNPKLYFKCKQIKLDKENEQLEFYIGKQLKNDKS
jgi:hypothetical protein